MVYPIWQDLIYRRSGTTLPVEYRIMTGDAFEEEIFHGRAVPSPEMRIAIKLNPLCADLLDSTLFPALVQEAMEGDTQIPMNGYRKFRLETYNNVGQWWEPTLEFEFTNDTSYAEKPAGYAYSEPINGHAAPGQLIPMTYLVEDIYDSIQFCYQTN